MTAKKEAFRFVLCCLFSFFVCLCLTAGAVLGLVKFCVFEEKSFTEAARRSDFSQYSLDYLEQKLRDYTLAVGLPQDFFDGIVSGEEVQALFEAEVGAAFHVASPGADYEILAERVREKLYDYAAQNGMELTDEIRQNLEQLVLEIRALLQNVTSIPGMHYIAEFGGQFERVLLPGLLVLLTVFLFSLLLLFWLTQKSVPQLLRFLACACFGGTLLAGALPAALLFAGTATKLSLSPEFLYRLVSTFLTGFLQNFVWVAFGFLVLGGLLLLAGYLAAKKGPVIPQEK